jgi:hypothetical protein
MSQMTMVSDPEFYVALGAGGFEHARLKSGVRASHGALGAGPISWNGPSSRPSTIRARLCRAKKGRKRKFAHLLGRRVAKS